MGKNRNIVSGAMFLFLYVNILNGVAQPTNAKLVVELPHQKMQVKEIMDLVSSNYGYSFSYSSRFLDEEEWFILKEESITLTLLLKKICLKCKVSYKVIKKTIVFYLEEKETGDTRVRITTRSRV